MILKEINKKIDALKGQPVQMQLSDSFKKQVNNLVKWKDQLVSNDALYFIILCIFHYTYIRATLNLIHYRYECYPIFLMD